MKACAIQGPLAAGPSRSSPLCAQQPPPMSRLRKRPGRSGQSSAPAGRLPARHPPPAPLLPARHPPPAPPGPGFPLPGSAQQLASAPHRGPVELAHSPPPPPPPAAPHRGPVELAHAARAHHRRRPRPRRALERQVRRRACRVMAQDILANYIYNYNQRRQVRRRACRVTDAQCLPANYKIY